MTKKKKIVNEMRQSLKELATVMLAFSENKTIQQRSSEDEPWVDVAEPDWHSGKYMFRVKPEPKYRPYTHWEFIKAQAEHGMYLIMKNQPNFLAVMPTEINATGIAAWGNNYLYNELMCYMKWIDDTPCDILLPEDNE